jgi:Glycosyl transferases group 1/Glycosyltransferase Family 4
MTKVCIVVQNHPSVTMGGAQYQGHLLAEALAQRPDVEVTYLARDVPERIAAPLGSNYAIRCIGTFKGLGHRTSLVDSPRLWRTLQQIKPDVVYQQMRQGYTAVCAHYCRVFRIPFFFQIASDLDLQTTWITNGVSANVPFDIAEAASGLWGLRHASHILAQTARQARILRETFGLDAAAVVRNFQRLPDALAKKPDYPIEVFWVANFKDVKRPDLFVALAEEFQGRPELRFTIAGRPSGQKRRFAALMKRIAAAKNLEYLGELPIDAVNKRMAQAHIHVNTSSHEGFPNTFIQAWAQGAVVATIDVDPDEEGMEALGIGIKAGTLQRLCAVVDDLSRSSERRQAFAGRAFQFVHANHSMDRATELVDMMLGAGRVAKLGSPDRDVT